MCGKILVLDSGPDAGRELECIRAYPPVHVVHHNTVAEWYRITPGLGAIVPGWFAVRYFELVKEG